MGRKMADNGGLGKQLYDVTVGLLKGGASNRQFLLTPDERDDVESTLKPYEYNGYYYRIEPMQTYGFNEFLRLVSSIFGGQQQKVTHKTERNTMSKKIAAADNDAMNTLYAGEFTRLATDAKLTEADWKDEKGAPHDPVAFEDHADYLATLKSVMSEDKREGFDPNSTELD